MRENKDCLVTEERYAELRDRMIELLKKSEGIEEHTDNIDVLAFEAIYNGCDDLSMWIQTMIECYPEEIIATFGSNPFEIYHELTDWWDSKEYEDPRTGINLKYKEWADFFANASAHYIYRELIETKKKKK